MAGASGPRLGTAVLLGLISRGQFSFAASYPLLLIRRQKLLEIGRIDRLPPRRLVVPHVVFGGRIVDLEAYIFTNPNTGKQWQGVQAQLRCFWNPTLRALGLRHRDAYETRHTFASTLLMGGSNPVWIARQLGHASTAMVFKVYARWIEGADKGAEAAKANAILSSNRPRDDAAA